MAIIKNYPADLDKATKYDLMRNPKMQKLSTAKGQRLTVIAYMLREEENNDGEIVKILSLKTKEGDLFATNSPVCIREFEAVIDCLDGDEPEFDLAVIDGVSRGGRHYVTCAWAHD